MTSVKIDVAAFNAALKRVAVIASANPAVKFETGVLNLSLLERNAIQQALAQSNGNKTAAAHLLGISRRTLQRKLQDILHS